MTTNTESKPFQIKITDAELEDLHRRLDATRWPDPAPDGRTDFARGVPLAYLQELTDYWRHRFDWRAQEARLNRIPQFTIEIDGQQIHYLHVRSPEPDALPLLIIHGYPSSVVEVARPVLRYRDGSAPNWLAAYERQVTHVGAASRTAAHCQ